MKNKVKETREEQEELKEEKEQLEVQNELLKEQPRYAQRGLFDLYFAEQHASIDIESVLQCYEYYMKISPGRLPTKKQFLQNLEEKIEDPSFEGDLEGLLREGIDHDQNEAFSWLQDKVIEHMR